MNVLITGGAGDVGSILRPTLEARYDCYHLDLRPIEGVAERRMFVGSINDEALLRHALTGMQAVIHLAMGARPGTRKDLSDLEAVFGVNVLGTYRLLDAAMRSGVRRFVNASSGSVYERLVSLPRVDESMPASAWHIYGMSKRLGEVMCFGATQQWPDAGVVVLRLHQPTDEAKWAEYRYERGKRWYPLGPDDTRRLFIAAIERTAKPGYVVVQTSGDLHGDRYPNEEAERLLGWRPEGR